MKKIRELITLLCWPLLANSQERTFTPVEKMTWHQLGDKRIFVRTSSYGTTRSRVVVNLHHNEVTSLQAAKAILSANGGLLINIENDNERLISFSIRGRRIRFDPNRIFTDAGIRLTLQKLNRTVPSSATKAVRRFAVFLKSKIPAGAKTIVAVHNNEDGELSVDSYTNGGDLQKDAKDVHQSARHDADNFFFTTSSSVFDKLKKKGWNVVLQHNEKAADDGSLSIYYGRRKKAYVNVEAEQGRLSEQRDMLSLLMNLLTDK